MYVSQLHQPPSLFPLPTPPDCVLFYYASIHSVTMILQELNKDYQPKISFTHTKSLESIYETPVGDFVIVDIKQFSIPCNTTQPSTLNTQDTHNCSRDASSEYGNHVEKSVSISCGPSEVQELEDNSCSSAFSDFEPTSKANDSYDCTGN